ncbi:MAG: cytochrome b/b6 domain-containing protein [Magnetococcales bacterium]|nr:cytochrome b/b6 domain-containing protein [Magnetococcales bacterium]
MTTSARSDDTVNDHPATGGLPDRGSPVRVWDLPTRLFHWALVLAVLSAFVSRKFGDAMLVWHMANGYAILVLVLFRLLWGLFGSTTARFRSFLTGPGAVIDYLRANLKGEHPRFVGHNPAGGWSVAALLTILALQGVTGLFASDDILVKGPLAFLVSDKTVALASTIHRLSFLALLALVTLHLGAVLFYLAKGDNLILPMFTGDKTPSQLPSDAPPVRMRSNGRALMLLVLALGVVWAGISLWKW